MNIEIAEAQPINHSEWNFEISWEVANKVGGIYTVLKSKSGWCVGELGQRYVVMGPYQDNCIGQEIEECELDADSALGKTVNQLRYRGFRVVTGKWLVEGRPLTILFDIDSVWWAFERYRYEILVDNDIQLPGDSMTRSVVQFGFMVAQFMADFNKHLTGRPNVIAHFHEWLTGVGLLLVRQWKLPVATIFTTHATILGRHLCAAGKDLITQILSSITEQAILDKECYNHGIYHQYCVERAAAHMAHVFTVVSGVTAIEVHQLLKRKPDLLTPNGLNIKNQLKKERQLLSEKKQNRALIDKFVMRHLSQPTDDKTFYFFIAGRYEFCNKGADIFIESLARLNYLLQTQDPDVTVVAFFFFPTQTDGWNDQTLLRHTGRASSDNRQRKPHMVNEESKDSTQIGLNDDSEPKIEPKIGARKVGVDGWESI